MITGDKKDTLERWLFNYSEPPYNESYETLTVQYRENLEELHRSEVEPEWDVDDLACTPDEVKEIVEERIAWLSHPDES